MNNNEITYYRKPTYSYIIINYYNTYVTQENHVTSLHFSSHPFISIHITSFH
jgi:hypothetical protein